MTRCTTCGLLLKYPNAHCSGSSEDECLYCKTFRRKEFHGERVLRERLSSEEVIGVTVSGGKDSLYVWHWLVDNFGPDRVVAFNHNKVNAVHEIAFKNIQNTKEILGSKVVIVNDFEFYPRFVRNLATYIKNRNPGILRAVLCAGCRYGISKQLLEEASRHNIRAVVNGASYLELAPFKKHHMQELGNGCDATGLLIGLSRSKEYLTENNLLTIMRDHFNCHAENDEDFVSSSGVDYVNFFDYVENDPEKIKSKVMSELGWSHPVEGDWHFDCIVEEFKQFFYLLEYGYSELDFKLSEMVRYGILDRKSAVLLIEKENARIRSSAPLIRCKLREYELDAEVVASFDDFCNQDSERKYA